MGASLAGLNLWVLWVGWPGLVAGGISAFEGLLSVLALGAFIAGMRALGARPAESPEGLSEAQPTGTAPAGRALRGLLALLLGVPASLATAVAARAETINQDAFDPWTIVPAALGLSLYGAAVLMHGRPHWLRHTGVSIPLTNRPWLTRAGRREALRRRILVAGLLGGGVAIGLVAPTMGGFGALRQAWHAAALEGGLLTAVLAGSLGTSIVGLSLAEAMRPKAAMPRHHKQTARVVSFLLLAVVGAVTYWLML